MEILRDKYNENSSDHSIDATVAVRLMHLNWFDGGGQVDLLQ